jgi:phenylacetyl-CoA:acceptor oxidoreductase
MLLGADPNRLPVWALEVPGSTLGTTVRLNRPADNRWSSVKPGPDGFMQYPMNPTGKADWISRPTARSAHRTLVPLVADSAWSQALGPTHLAWMMQDENFDKLPVASPPDVWFVYRTNPAVSFWDTKAIGKTMAKFPFVVCFAYTRDETNHVADVLLPDCTDLEGLQLLRIGGTKYVEQFWDTRICTCASRAAARGGQRFHLDSNRARPPHWPDRSL